jgi:NADP-dependent 3-hydroxy acid dehydrogenase YdfG
VGYYTGRAAVITGAGSGIGRALARCEARLMLVDRNRGRLDKTARKCRLLTGDVLTAEADVTDRQALTSCASTAADRFGHVGAVFGFAGVIHTGSLLNSEFGDIDS